MKKLFPKKTSLLAFLAALALVLLACGSEEDQESAEMDQWEGPVRVATVGTGHPYSLVEEDGTWTGTEAEIWEEIEERTGWDVQVQRVGSSATFGQLDTDRSDVAANNYGLTEERAEKYIYTVPAYADANTIGVKSDNEDIQSLEDLSGKTVGVQAGQAADIPLTEMAEEMDFEVVRYDSTTDAFLQLEIDSVDAVGAPRSLLNEYIETRDADFRILEENLTAAPVVYFLPDTPEHAQLRDELNVVIEDMVEDGTMGEITEKWLFSDMTKNLEDIDLDEYDFD